MIFGEGEENRNSVTFLLVSSLHPHNIAITMRLPNVENLDQDLGMTAHPLPDPVDLRPVHLPVVPDVLPALADVALHAADTQLA